MSVVSIVKCPDYYYKNVEDAVEQSINNIGGLDDIIKKGDKVLLKINLTDIKEPNKAVTTHPSIVKAVAKKIKELGAHVLLGESSGCYQWKLWNSIRQKIRGKFYKMDYETASNFFTEMRKLENPYDIVDLTLKGRPLFTLEDLEIDSISNEIFAPTGMRKVAEEIGAECVSFDAEQWIEAPFPQGEFLKKVLVSKSLLDADVVVSLPKLKTHDLMWYTGAIKNFLGIVPGGQKSRYHEVAYATGNMGEMLVDIFQFVKPKLVINDGIVGMEGEGPLEGKPRKIGVVLAGKDLVAADAVACAIINMDPLDVATTRIAAQRGLGVGDIKKIKIAGESIENVKVADFLMHSHFTKQS
ncbi:MAG: DUF362 domain-containing protein [Spirochaetales bacterium]|nr:DUF362 domain-containing protein [Spirochaetales bacterium]